MDISENRLPPEKRDFRWVKNNFHGHDISRPTPCASLSVPSFSLDLGAMTIILTMFVWWRDVIREAPFQGHHTQMVKRGLRYGMILFITSEVCFFFAFFWAFFHSSLSPTI